MKNLSILLMLAVVLSLAGCDTDSTPDNPGPGMPPPLRNFDKENFDKSLEAWEEQGISDYSFDVWGYEYEPNIPFRALMGYDSPSDAKFCAHVTVADGNITSIENVGETGAYTWGAIPDIFDRILSISVEDASSPYAYHWTVGYSLDGTYPSYLKSLSIRIYTYDPFSSLYPKYPGPVVLYEVLLIINNFQVAKNVPY